MDAATFLGSSPVLAAVVGLAVVLLLVRRRRAEAAFLVVAFVGSLVLNDWLKALFQRPRPGFDWAEVWPETGFPSGHSMNSFVVYLAIALVIWRLGGRRVGDRRAGPRDRAWWSASASAGSTSEPTGCPTSSVATWPGRCGCCSWSLRGALSHASAGRSRRDAAPGDGEMRPVPSRPAR